MSGKAVGGARVAALPEVAPRILEYPVVESEDPVVNPEGAGQPPQDPAELQRGCRGDEPDGRALRWRPEDERHGRGEGRAFHDVGAFSRRSGTHRLGAARFA